MENIFVFFIGAIFGSCINVIGYRYVRNMDFIFGFSCCPNCKKRIPFYQMIPFISFLLLKGKCSNCKSNISLRYPLTELVGGMILFLLHIKGKMNYTIVCYMLFLISIIDFETMEVDDRFQIILLINVMVLSNNSIHLFFTVILATILIILYHYEKIGGADVKLLIILSLLGVRMNIVAIYITLFFSFFVCFYLLIIKKHSIDRRIPFIPLLSLGYILAILYSEELIAIYSQIWLT